MTLGSLSNGAFASGLAGGSPAPASGGAGLTAGLAALNPYLGIASALNSFIQTNEGQIDQDEDHARAFSSTLGNLQNLLGTGFEPGTFRPDQAVQAGGFQSQFLAPGTVVQTQQGDSGLDPRIAEMRARLFSLISNPSISQEQGKRADVSSGVSLAGQLSEGGQAGTLQGLAGQSQGFGGAGVGRAQSQVSRALLNRQQRLQAKGAAQQFTGGLYGIAGGTI